MHVHAHIRMHTYTAEGFTELGHQNKPTQAEEIVKALETETVKERERDKERKERERREIHSREAKKLPP